MNMVKTLITVVALSLSFGGLGYAKNHNGKHLPPGLQKKVQSGKSLPPGWQRKLAVGETLDQGVFDLGKVVSKNSKEGLITVNIEGKIVRVIEKTREIVEILDSL